MMQQILKTYPVSKHSFFDRLKIFELLNLATNWDWIAHQGFHLPAIKEAYAWCGQWAWRGCLNVDAHTTRGYPDKIEAKTFQRHCYRPDCKICYRYWIVREANKATRCIEKYEKLSEKPAKHIVVSPPDWLYGKDLVALRREAIKIVKEVKAEGGSIVTHPFRQEKTVNVYADENRNWYFSPHFHIVGFGWIDGVAEAYKKNGGLLRMLV